MLSCYHLFLFSLSLFFLLIWVYIKLTYNETDISMQISLFQENKLLLSLSSWLIPVPCHWLCLISAYHTVTRRDLDKYSCPRLQKAQGYHPKQLKCCRPQLTELYRLTKLHHSLQTIKNKRHTCTKANNQLNIFTIYRHISPFSDFSRVAILLSIVNDYLYADHMNSSQQRHMLLRWMLNDAERINIEQANRFLALDKQNWMQLSDMYWHPSV